jgi:hypothetical protein
MVRIYRSNISAELYFVPPDSSDILMIDNVVLQTRTLGYI